MNSPGAPAISVVILNHNGRPWLRGCLDALAAQRNAPAFELILVDNGSSDGSAAFVTSTYANVRVVRLETNLGFAGGNNAGARAASGEWLAFLNNDTVPDSTWLAQLHAAASAHPHCSLIASRIVFLHDPDRVDSAGDGYFRAGGAFKTGHGLEASSFAASREVFGACGAAFMIARAAFDALGGFDERFFMVYEDVDLSYRARLRGYRCWYAADAIVRHAGSGTLGAVSADAVFYGQRNLEWTWIKNTPRRLLLRTAPAHVIYSFAGILHYARAGLLGAALGGKWAALAGLGKALTDRRAIQARAAADADVERWMDRRWLAAKRREKSFDTGRRITAHPPAPPSRSAS